MEINKEQLSSDQKKQYRSMLFRYLDGFAICTTVAALKKHGILEHLQNEKSILLSKCVSRFSANEGSLNVGLRLLCSQGWLVREKIGINDIQYSVTSIGREMMNAAELYEQAALLLPCFVNLGSNLNSIQEVENLKKISQFLMDLPGHSQDRVNDTVLSHIIGCFVSPCLVALGRNNNICLTKTGHLIPPSDFTGNSSIYREILNILTECRLIKNGMIPEWTPNGNFLRKRATAFGVTVSYLPMFCQVDNLIFGNPSVIWQKNEEGSETHVDRAMNVWGSGGAHSMYFNRIDDIVLSIFNQPLESQPVGVADMGCGNGQFLEHLYVLICNNTIRGKHLKEYPLNIIGADFNDSALTETGKTLSSASIKHILISADISRPNDFARKLKKENVNLAKCLNVRSFLDHNRKLDPAFLSSSSENQEYIPGAFAMLGERVDVRNVYRDLVRHFKNWQIYIKEFGLICLELHTVPSSWSAASLGSQAATAYDATHGYSDQYIIDYNTFKRAVNESGLTFDPKYNWFFPSTQHPAISINYIH